MIGWNIWYSIIGIDNPSLYISNFNIINVSLSIILYTFFRIFSHSPNSIVEILLYCLLFWLYDEVISNKIFSSFIIISFFSLPITLNNISSMEPFVIWFSISFNNILIIWILLLFILQILFKNFIDVHSFICL